jgi:hypothetical protein
MNIYYEPVNLTAGEYEDDTINAKSRGEIGTKDQPTPPKPCISSIPFFSTQNKKWTSS